jgi:pimeloyl-ACP methyl ester carboxylesterase
VTETLTAGPARLRAYVAGAGPPVILLHGLGGAAANWIEVAPTLARSHRVVALDLPGHGASPPLAGAADLTGFVDAVGGALEDLGVAPALVAGHSFGGQIAVGLAARRPELVRGLVLVAPAGIGTCTRRVRTAVTVSTIVRPGRLVAPLGPRLARRAWFRWAVFRPFFVSDGLIMSTRAAQGFLAEMLAHSDTRAAGRAMVADDVRLRLSDVNCPAVIVWGARDRQLGLDDAFEYARQLRAQLRVVADCGHLVPGERPGAVVDAVAALA